MMATHADADDVPRSERARHGGSPEGLPRPPRSGRRGHGHRPPAPSTRGPLLLTLPGVALAALATGLLHAVWSAGQPGHSLGEALRAFPSQGDWGAAVLGGLGAFLVLGVRLRNRLALAGVAAGRRLLLVGLGALLGLAFAVAAGLLVRMVTPAGLAQLTQDPAGLVLRPGPLHVLAALGLVAGALWAVRVGQLSLRSAGEVLGGAAAGGGAAWLVVSLGQLMAMPGSGGEAAVAGGAAGAAADGAGWAALVPRGAVLAVVLCGCALGAALSRNAWRFGGIVAISALLAVVAGYLLLAVGVALPQVPAGQRAFSWVLLALEAAMLGLVLLSSFYTIDVAARRRWQRKPRREASSQYYLPMVAIHVPTYNEPFDVVRPTLECLLRLDYPRDRYVVLVGDDSTDPACSGPLAAFCESRGITYVRRPDRSGYKAGALNALLERTPKEASLLAVVDADYQVAPAFLQRTVGYFADPDLAWLQTPQDYRNRHESFLTEQYYLADAYFYRAVLPSRNEENSIIFCGTMGILRREALEAVGGWDEACITEDAELSVRLLQAGWTSQYADERYGQGLIPSTFEAFRSQHHRWAFGGGRILRTHGVRLLLGRFTARQRLDLLLGTVHWLEGWVLLGLAGAMLYLAGADLLGLGAATHHSGEILLVGLLPVLLVAEGLTRVHLVLRRSVNADWRQTLGILGLWSAVKFSNMRGAARGLLGGRIAFLRTPKTAGERRTPLGALLHAVRTTPFETGMAALLGLAAVAMWAKALAGGEAALGRLLLGVWLVYYGALFAAAPLFAYVASRPRPTFAEARALRPATQRPATLRRPARPPAAQPVEPAVPLPAATPAPARAPAPSPAPEPAVPPTPYAPVFPRRGALRAPPVPRGVWVKPPRRVEWTAEHAAEWPEAPELEDAQRWRRR